MRDLLTRTPDRPRFVETRGLLLSGRAKVYGPDSRNLGFVVCGTALPIVSAVDEPPVALIRRAVDEASARDFGFAFLRRGLDVIAAPELRALVQEALPEWRATPAVIHGLRELELADAAGPDVRMLLAGELDFGHVPADLRAEIEGALARTECAATFLDGRPVSFCYAAAETETLWDISIDTMEAYRRRGAAAAAVRRMVARMRERGKRPVWGALETNEPSLRLAHKLGFTPVDRLVVFSRG